MNESPEKANVAQLSADASALGPREAADLLSPHGPNLIAQVMLRLPPTVRGRILEEMDPSLRESVFAAAAPETARQWRLNLTYPQDTVGRMMEPPDGIFLPDTTVRQAVELLREMVRRAFITYGYVNDEQGRLIGVVVMRELVLADPDATLAQIMLRDPFSLRPDMPQLDAMKAVLAKHFPVYPVCDENGRLVGLMRGSTLFQQQAVELTAQAGSMVGVDKEERLATPWLRSLKFRQPWLQLNLLTAFVAAGVVSMFQGTIDKVIVLAAFLPVLAGQSGNTGCQALAVSLRGMTLGEMKAGNGKVIVIKEALLGLCNGALVGITAGAGMYFYASSQSGEAAMSSQQSLTLAVIVFAAMTASCVISGISGVLVPLTLKRFGFDPATASSIFLTTATDVASMGLLLGLATMVMR